MTLAEKFRQEGRILEKKATLLLIVRNANKQGVSIEDIAQIVRLDKDLVQKIIDNNEFEIPLNLLEPND